MVWSNRSSEEPKRLRCGQGDWYAKVDGAKGLLTRPMRKGLYS